MIHTIYKDNSVTWVETKRLDQYLEQGWRLDAEQDEEIKVTLKPSKRSKK